jgi:hypothetical protein
MRRLPVAFCALTFALLAFVTSQGQTPPPVIIQAATPVPAAIAKPAAAAPATNTKTTLQLLQEMQATNAATIKKQEAALATLDELQKAAEEIKIFSKRG